MEAMVKRLDQLTQDEARLAVAQILNIVHGLLRNTKIIMEGEQSSLCFSPAWCSGTFLVDGNASVDYLKDALGMFLSQQSSESISDWASETMHQIASNLTKSKRESFFDVAIAEWDHRDCPAGDNLQQDIIEWLSPPDYSNNHHSTCELRHPGSAEWFIQGNTFSEWKSSDVPVSLLWVRGKRAFMSGSSALLETEILVFQSGRVKKRTLVRRTSDVLVSGTYRASQLHDHRGHRRHAENWASIISIFLLQF